MARLTPRFPARQLAEHCPYAAFNRMEHPKACRNLTIALKTVAANLWQRSTSHPAQCWIASAVGRPEEARGSHYDPQGKRWPWEYDRWRSGFGIDIKVPLRGWSPAVGQGLEGGAELLTARRLWHLAPGNVLTPRAPRLRAGDDSATTARFPGNLVPVREGMQREMSPCLSLPGLDMILARWPLHKAKQGSGFRRRATE